MISHICIILVSLLAVILIIGLHLHRDYCITCKSSLSNRLEKFENMRDTLRKREYYQSVGAGMSLTAKEEKVNELLMTLKHNELKNRHQSISNSSSDAVNGQSELFALLLEMPKGGLLHVRDTDLCDVNCLLSLTYHNYLWICIDKIKQIDVNSYLAMRFSLRTPDKRTFEGKSCKWTLLQDLRERFGEKYVDEILRKRLLMTNGIEDRFLHGLITFKPIWEAIHMRGFENLYMEGVQYVEIKSSLPLLYNIYNGNWTTLDTAKIVQKISSKFSSLGNFFGSRLIYAPNGNVTFGTLNEHINHALFLQQQLDNYLIGIDLGNLQFHSIGLNYFAKEILAAEMQLQFYFHAAANKCWNLMDAMLLSVQRISCVTELLLHPQLKQLAKTGDFPMELSHTHAECSKIASHLFANGLNAVLVFPDAMIASSTPLTNEFYYTFMEIVPKTSPLRTIKQLLWNSVKYSSLGLQDKISLLNIWYKQWNSWINEVCEDHNLNIDSIFEAWFSVFDF